MFVQKSLELFIYQCILVMFTNHIIYMNKIEPTVTLECAKLLKKSQWNIPTMFYWKADVIINGEPLSYELSITGRLEKLKDTDYWAPQFHELLERLPHVYINIPGADPLSSTPVLFAKTDSGYCIRHQNIDTIYSSKNPHDVAALLWMKCKKKKLISNH